MARSSSLQSLSSARAVPTRLSRPIMTLFSTSSRPARLNCWKIMAQRARHWRNARPLSAVMSVSPNRMRPRLGSPRR